MPRPAAPLARLAYMAFRDLAGEWPVSLAVSLAITAVAAPVLVLIALYSGVVGEIFAGLRSAPAVREIRLAATGAASFDDRWFEEVRRWPEVSFAVPSTRYASAQAQVIDAEGRREARATLLPTGAGDPVFPPGGLVPAAPRAVGISASLARKVGAVAGGALQIEVTRGGTDGGGIERVLVPLEVAAVADAGRFGGDALFVAPAFLVEIEDFKDGHRAPLLGVAGSEPPPRAHFPDFRLYADDIASVGPLVRRLEAEPHNLTLRTEESRIAFAMRLDRSLRTVIAVVGALGLLGLAGGLWTIQWSMAARRRRTIAVLNLIGFGRAALVGLPVLQSLMLGAVASLATVATAWAFTLLVDSVLADSIGLEGTRLGAGAIALVTGLILTVSVLPALWIGRMYARLEASDEIRET